MSGPDGGILACEAVSRAGSVCLIDGDGEQRVFQELEHGQAAARLPLLLHDCLERQPRPASLAVAAGPGSFTGLRVSVVALRTLAWHEGLPVRSVDSLTALACGNGDGLWWTLLPLKKDVTFHALYRVEDGRADCLVPCAAIADRDPPPLDERYQGATAVGPALREKADLLQRWAPEIRRGSMRGCDARGVAQAARACPMRDWRELRPDYRMASAPELQRRGRGS